MILLASSKENVRDRRDPNSSNTLEGISLNVAKGCDGMEPLALFIIGVLLVPFAWRSIWIICGRSEEGYAVPIGRE